MNDDVLIGNPFGNDRRQAHAVSQRRTSKTRRTIASNGPR